MEAISCVAPRPEDPTAIPGLQVPLKYVLDQMLRDKHEMKKDGTSQRRRLKSSMQAPLPSALVRSSSKAIRRVKASC